MVRTKIFFSKFIYECHVFEFFPDRIMYVLVTTFFEIFSLRCGIQNYSFSETMFLEGSIVVIFSVSLIFSAETIYARVNKNA
jgi:hypothetical protein